MDSPHVNFVAGVIVGELTYLLTNVIKDDPSLIRYLVGFKPSLL